ncbi:HD domain-containing protein [Acaryochloris marina]|uniref:Metal dependent phosphohydrolase, putative n=1 Tax=Acaryochloris marina (strain MBIC 11017) TaxID=329726 RepID=B0C0F0_ACAM1|nr:HD domain-containing protein [Acaryochloris marina]ABW29642.1 metal dependent phosphohydrolase, putative [Acaryochloris marina MBIC11017]BDM78543.1 phosphohydrolase [Acaryochloris marina MBIC10699]
MQPLPSRTYHDPLHGSITLTAQDPVESLLIQLIDTPEFQRLRRIRQLGTASLTFHGAEGSRFTHSLGVMHVARLAFDRLIQTYPQLLPYRALVLCGALLHDIGHGPYSHTGEDIFNSHHETWTRTILRESPRMRTLLDQFDPDLASQLEQVYLKTFELPIVSQLVSSQLDCDRLDYLLRDSYFTGASYGQLDLDRILMALDYDPQTQQLVVEQKGQAAIEHYLVVRYFMYAQIYNHPKNLASAWGLVQAFRRAKELLKEGKISADQTVRAWLFQTDGNLSLQDYLAADDIVFTYHLHLWQQSNDAILSNLCRRHLNRDLLKAMDITDLTAAQQQDCLAHSQKLVQAQGWDPNYYTGLQVALTRGYTLYQRGINLLTGQGLVEISEVSVLVQALIQPFRRAWIIYPLGIENDLKQIPVLQEQRQ